MARSGDQAALEMLCDRYLPIIYNRLRALLPFEVVEDVTQEVFLAAMRSIRRYRERSSFRTWISAIARHKAIDYYRKRGRQLEAVSLDAGEGNDPPSRDAWQERALVRVALQHLPAHYQEILFLRLAEGMRFKEIAEELDISLEATKSRYRRAVAAVAREMDVERGG
jgi:RNA polymerase sigma-70 factor (ECF subfamily)